MRKSATDSQAQLVSQPGPGQPTAKGLGRVFSSLRQPDFRLYWSGQVISLTGSSMQSLGQTWLVLELTNNAWQLGLVGALQFMPVLLFSLFGGVLADRWPKRRTLLFTQAASGLQALVLWLLLVTGAVQLWHIYVLAVLLGLTNSLDKPTRQVFVAEIVGREELPNAVALNSSSASLTRIIGPGLGGIIIAAGGVSMLFLLNALSFLPVLVSLVLIKPQKLPAPTVPATRSSGPPKIWQSLGEGLAYVWETPAISLVILVVGLVLLFGSNFNVVLPLFATEVLSAGASGFGFLSAALGVGALLASLWLAWSNYRPTIGRILVSTLIFGLLEIGLALSHNYLLALGITASIGFAEIVFASLAITTLQTVTPDHLRGRVISIYLLFFDGSVPLGYLMTGALLSWCGPSVALLICAFLTLLVSGSGWLWHKKSKL